MVKNDLTKKFSKGIIVIHWLSALLIFSLFALGIIMSNTENINEKLDLLKPHAVLGSLLFILTLVRSVMFFKQKRPEDLKTGTKFVDKLAVAIHNAFYILLILISISGIATMILGGYIDALSASNSSLVKSSELLPSAKAHMVLSYFTMVLVAMHVIGVIKHYVLTKENTLKRIM